MNAIKRMGCALLIVLMTACGAAKEKTSENRVDSAATPSSVSEQPPDDNSTAEIFKKNFIQSCAAGFKEEAKNMTFDDSQVNAFCECGYTKGFENYSTGEIVSLGLRMMANGGDLPEDVQEKMKVVIPVCLKQSFE